MAYEYINVRMSRSNANINWGFTLRQGSGNELVISSVEKDSMAEKAGLLLNDTVQEIFGRSGADINEARNRIQNANDVTMVLKRFVSTPPSLPWNLDEKDSKVFVNHFDSQGRNLGRSDQKTNGYVNSFVSSSGSGAPLSQSSYNTSNYSRNINETSTNVPISYGLQPFRDTTNNALALPGSNTVSSESHSKWDTTEGNVKKHFESSRSYQRTESSSVSPAGAGGGFGTNWGTTGSNWGQIGGGGGGFSSTTGGGGFSSTTGGGPNWGSSGAGGFTSGFTSGGGGGGAPFTSSQNQSNNYQSFNSSTGSGAYGGGAGGGGSGGQFGGGAQRTSQYDRQPQFDEKRAASMQPTYVKTGGQYGGGRGGGAQDRAQSTTPNSGPRAYYQHSPRTYRELSPQATIRHLQYNTPMGLYSPEAAAEQFKMQTGQNMRVDPDYPSTRPVWMDSATRRAIEEEEQGRRGLSPVHQSSCFKRISAACGTPVQ
uniref:PDZ domain-containing protein n=1 Tax=Acrobeloides nanus TaxID=290746 RepID=A0A914E5W6_9BILA